MLPGFGMEKYFVVQSAFGTANFFMDELKDHYLKTTC
jgi:hypothetical protein